MNAKAMTQTFQSCMCRGVENIYLVNKTGALVLAANNYETARTLGAIVSNIWTDYDSCMSNQESGDILKSMIIEGETGVITVESICNMYLCIQGGNDVGRLLEISHRLREILEVPLQEIISG